MDVLKLTSAHREDMGNPIHIVADRIVFTKLGNRNDSTYVKLDVGSEANDYIFVQETPEQITAMLKGVK